MLIAVSSIRDGCELIKITKEEVTGELSWGIGRERTEQES
jgi:hypothetical protein